jgi:uncharacterized protein involved in response to NO
MGLIIAGMITRTAMGHTGRQIVAGRIELAFFLLIVLSGLLRVLAASPQLLSTTQTNALLLSSGMAWSLGFLAYAYRYAPWLFHPRIDGRPG